MENIHLALPFFVISLTASALSQRQGVAGGYDANRCLETPKADLSLQNLNPKSMGIVQRVYTNNIYIYNMYASALRVEPPLKQWGPVTIVVYRSGLSSKLVPRPFFSWKLVEPEGQGTSRGRGPRPYRGSPPCDFAASPHVRQAGLVSKKNQKK